MKVVLFCGGLGMRLREYSENIPKPMVNIGYRPIIWHVMKYYAHYGYNDFILCLGYRADMIKNYFLNYDECLSNNFTLYTGSKQINLLSSDVKDWKITFVDTSLTANIGQRLRAVRRFLEGQETFMANYSDGLINLPLPLLLDNFYKHNKIASMLCVKPGQSFHIVSSGKEGVVNSIEPVTKADMWINAGYFIFKKEIFDYLEEGEELVEEPFQRLIAQRQLISYKYEGFFACMDTFKDKQRLDDMYARGEAPWEMWRQS